MLQNKRIFTLKYRFSHSYLKNLNNLMQILRGKEELRKNLFVSQRSTKMNQIINVFHKNITAFKMVDAIFYFVCNIILRLQAQK